MKDSTMKILGIVAAVAGAGVTLFSNVVSDKKMDAKIEEKVLKALAGKEK